MNYIDEIDYATSFDDRDSAKTIISTIDDDNSYKISQYEGMFIIKVYDEDGDFLGYYAD